MKLIKRKQGITQLLDDNEVILTAAKFVVEVERLYGKVPEIKVKLATDLKVPLLAIAISGRIQADHARKRLEALNAAIEYVNGDRSARKRYIIASQQADRLADIVAKRVDRI
ncbi:hypothetical protein KQ41_21815 [Lysinibacillus fusiformis]|uniref:hypothetical protein n=1 Tax=Lysinibacillus fusiformis TaxID=28031 RepID=UPI0005028EAA|nr:hypothetical protein [Lysinibacillus fusiformis]KGA81429.1 hypothetical protein KQ41_21815 [Lysinibacillus fusiformis]